MALRPERHTLLTVVAGTRHRDAGLDRGLAGGDLALAGQEDLAHEDVVDLVGGDAGPLESRLDGEAPEVHGRKAGEALPRACRSACGPRDDDGTGHQGTP